MRDQAIRSSRREMLAAAAAGAAALAANALAKPLPAAAVSTTLMTEVDNATTAETSITGDIPVGTGDDLRVVFEGNSTNDAVGIRGYSASGQGIAGDSDSGIGVSGRVGETGPNFESIPAGVLGLGAVVDSSGVAGVGEVGVEGNGAIGVFGFGTNGVFGVGDGLGPPGLYGTGVVGYSGTMTPPAAPNNVGVYARGDGASAALRVQGKAIFSRSGRTSISAGRYYRVVTLAGVTSSSLVLVTLQTRRTGVYVAAAVPTTGKFTVYLNKTVTATTYFAYLVLN